MRELILAFMILLFIGFLFDKVKGLILVSIVFLPFLLLFTVFCLGFDDAGIIPKEIKTLILFCVGLGVYGEVALITLFINLIKKEKKKK